MYEYFISSLQRSRNKRSWNMRYWMQLKTFLPKNTMADHCLTCTHVAEHPVAKHPYTIGQFAHNYSICTSCNLPFAAVLVTIWKWTFVKFCIRAAEKAELHVTKEGMPQFDIIPKNDSMAVACWYTYDRFHYY